MDDRYTLTEIEQKLRLTDKLVDSFRQLRQLLDPALEALFADEETPAPVTVSTSYWATTQKKQDGLLFKSDAVALTEEDGKFYLLGRWSNRWMDSDREIITHDAHEEYHQYLDAHPDQAPELWVWHTPGTAHTHRARWWDYSGAFTYGLWELTAAEAERLHKGFLSRHEPGMSHGTYVLHYDIPARLIERYRTFEVSILPQRYAANQWTSFEMLRKELLEMNKGFTPEKRSVLVEIFGEEMVQTLEANDELQAKALDVLVQTKEADGGSPVADGAAEETQQEETDADPGQQPKANSGASSGAPAQPQYVTAEEVVAALGRLETALTAQFKALNERIDQVEKADAEKVAEQVAAAPMSILTNWMPKSILEGNEAALRKDSPLLKKQPAKPAPGQGGQPMSILDGFVQRTQ
jgi:hypothetical protein